MKECKYEDCRFWICVVILCVILLPHLTLKLNDIYTKNTAEFDVSCCGIGVYGVDIFLKIVLLTGR